MTGLLKLMGVYELYFSCVGLLAVVVCDVRDQLGAGEAYREIYGERESLETRRLATPKEKC